MKFMALLRYSANGSSGVFLNPILDLSNFCPDDDRWIEIAELLAQTQLRLTTQPTIVTLVPLQTLSYKTPRWLVSGWASSNSMQNPSHRFALLTTKDSQAPIDSWEDLIQFFLSTLSLDDEPGATGILSFYPVENFGLDEELPCLALLKTPSSSGTMWANRFASLQLVKNETPEGTSISTALTVLDPPLDSGAIPLPFSLIPLTSLAKLSGKCFCVTVGLPHRSGGIATTFIVTESQPKPISITEDIVNDLLAQLEAIHPENTPGLWSIYPCG